MTQQRDGIRRGNFPCVGELANCEDCELHTVVIIDEILELVSSLAQDDRNTGLAVVVNRKALIGVASENGIYGHSRFCNTDFDDKLACLNLSGV